MRDFMQKDLFELKFSHLDDLDLNSIKYNAALILFWGSQHFPFVSFRLISLNAVLSICYWNTLGL